jgi:hypothetical protein
VHTNVLTRSAKTVDNGLRTMFRQVSTFVCVKQGFADSRALDTDEVDLIVPKVCNIVRSIRIDMHTAEALSFGYRYQIRYMDKISTSLRFD